MRRGCSTPPPKMTPPFAASWSRIDIVSFAPGIAFEAKQVEYLPKLDPESESVRMKGAFLLLVFMMTTAALGATASPLHAQLRSEAVVGVTTDHVEHLAIPGHASPIWAAAEQEHRERWGWFFLGGAALGAGTTWLVMSNSCGSCDGGAYTIAPATIVAGGAVLGAVVGGLIGHWIDKASSK